MRNSNRSSASSKPATTPVTKPEKPYEGFPMFAHPAGMWCKKIRGKLVYFTSWRLDPDGSGALEKFNHDWPYLKEGRTPPAVDLSEGITLEILCEDFLSSKNELLEAEELSHRTFRDYVKTCQALVDEFGKNRRVDDLRHDDFRSYRAKLAKRLGVVSLRNEINRISIVFNHGFKKHKSKIKGAENTSELFGGEFNKPSAKALRKNRNEAGPKVFTRDEVISILNASDEILRAMILLGLNCGFGNNDIASLPQSAVELDAGWINFPRPKTEIPRRIPLWPETISALQLAISKRPKPKDKADSGLCFLTGQGRRWVRVQEKKEQDEATDFVDMVPIDALTGRFGKVMKKPRCPECGTLQKSESPSKCKVCDWQPTEEEGWDKINGRRGLGFYSLRHCFETYSVPAKDQVAVDAIMGHVDNSMGANYRHNVPDEQLKAVVETVRTWLFRKGGEQ